MRLWCAECGTDSTETYVVTFTNGQDDPDGQTEVCRACDDELRS